MDQPNQMQISAPLVSKQEEIDPNKFKHEQMAQHLSFEDSKGDTQTQMEDYLNSTSTKILIKKPQDLKGIITSDSEDIYDKIDVHRSAPPHIALNNGVPDHTHTHPGDLVDKSPSKWDSNSSASRLYHTPTSTFETLPAEPSLSSLIKSDITQAMKMKGDSLVIWMNHVDRMGLTPIPMLEQYGMYMCWTDRGLSFLMEMDLGEQAREFVNHDAHPFLVLGMNPFKGKYLKDLCIARTNCSILAQNEPTKGPPFISNDHQLTEASLLKNSEGCETIPQNLPQSDDNKQNSLHNGLDPQDRPTRPHNEDSIVHSTRRKSTSPYQLPPPNPKKAKIQMNGFSKLFLPLDDIQKISFYTLYQTDKHRLDHRRFEINILLNQSKTRTSKEIESIETPHGPSTPTVPHPIYPTEQHKTLKSTRKAPNWEYFSLEPVTNELDGNTGLPIVLSEDCEILIGNKRPTSLRCNISLANHRVRAALNQTYWISTVSDTEDPTSDELQVEEDITRKDLIDLGNGLKAKQGTIIYVKYPNEYPGYFEEDKIAIYNRHTLKKCIEKVIEETEFGPDLSPMNLAQVAYRLFWGLVINSQGKVEHILEEFAPLAASRRFRRKSAWIKEISKSIQEKRLRCEAYRERLHKNEMLRQRDLDERFEEMNRELEAQANFKRRRSFEIKVEQERKYGKKFRHSPIQDTDEKSLIEAVIDPESGVFRRPMLSLTESQKRCIYQECIRKNITAPIKLVKLSSKGRAVLAAGLISKEDFVLEYRGELISEKEARERDCKYNRARINRGSFMFYFKHNSKNFSIDATDETAPLGPARLINHSMKNPNLIAKTISVDDVARLFFCAKRNIQENEELVVDYGERDPDVIQKNPWLNT